LTNTTINSIRPTEATIDLRALADNLRLVRGIVGPETGIIAVVKADGYGHGAVAIARLLEGLGVWGFGVATVEEGVELRDAKIHAPILIMGAAFGRDHKTVIERDLIPVVGDPGDVDHFAAAARAADAVRFSVHVKIDTGMTRLGVTTDGFEPFLRRCAGHPSIRVDGLATHFACSDEADPGPTQRQLQAFIRCLDRARSLGADPQVIHTANSAAALRFPETRFQLVRPGIALYGARPSEHVPGCAGLRPVLSLTTRINAIRRVAAGTHVSYNGTFTTRRPSVIATLPVGYADGYPRILSNRAQVLVREHRAPVVGRICMDLTMVDVTEIPGVEVGDRVSLLGGEGPLSIKPHELAAWARTITYEILCGVSGRVPRVYLEQAQEQEQEQARGGRSGRDAARRSLASVASTNGSGS
jgi:alanine racemase